PGTQRLYVPAEEGRLDYDRDNLTPPNARANSIEIPIKTLDEYGLENVWFMKVDVEGHELDVLKGAQATLERCRPNLLVEIEQRHVSFPMNRVFEHLEGLGYRGHFCYRGALRPLSEFSPRQHQEALLPDVFSPDYVNNFLFLP